MNNILNNHQTFQIRNNQKDFNNKVKNELTKLLKKLRGQQMIPPDILMIFQEIIQMLVLSVCCSQYAKQLKFFGVI